MNTTLLGLPIWPWWVVGGVLILLAIYFFATSKEPDTKEKEEVTKAPAQEVKAPAQEVKAPVEEVAAPAEEAKAPEEEVAAPVEEAKAPEEEVAAPIEQAVPAAPAEEETHEEPKVEPVAPEVVEGWAKEAEELFTAGGQENLAKAYNLFKQAADQGDVSSLLRTGYMSFLAYGTGQDVKKTVCAYQKAVELGSGKAAFLLGNLYKHGFGVEQSNEEAERLYALAKEKGYEA